MSRTQPALVNPSVLTWARDTARMLQQDAARKAAVSPERLSSWESGEALPTIRQARLLAHAYRIPFAALFLPQPPKGITRIPQDLRRHAGEVTDGVSSDIQLDVRDSWERREIALELLGDQGLAPASFTFTAALGEEPEDCGLRLRDTLGVQLAAQLRWRDPRVGFNQWRHFAEACGVLVLQTSNIPVSVLRAYSLFADPLPVIVVNRKDSYAARSFSLLHELTHLGLNSEGLCDLRTDGSRPPEEQRLEVFCNAVAAAALIPRASLISRQEVAARSGETWDDTTIQHLATAYSCSREALLRRLLTLGLTSRRFYELKRAQYQKEYEDLPRPKGFVTPPVNAVSILGRPLVRLILDGLSGDKITSSDAADYLGVRLKHLPAIAASVGESEV